MTLQTGRPPAVNANTARNLIVQSDAPNNEVVFFSHQNGNQFTFFGNTGDMTVEARTAVVDAIMTIESPRSQQAVLSDFESAGRATVRFTVSRDGTRITGAEVVTTSNDRMIARSDPPPPIRQGAPQQDQPAAVASAPTAPEQRAAAPTNPQPASRPQSAPAVAQQRRVAANQPVVHVSQPVVQPTAPTGPTRQDAQRAFQNVRTIMHDTILSYSDTVNQPTAYQNAVTDFATIIGRVETLVSQLPAESPQRIQADRHLNNARAGFNRYQDLANNRQNVTPESTHNHFFSEVGRPLNEALIIYRNFDFQNNPPQTN